MYCTSLAKRLLQSDHWEQGLRSHVRPCVSSPLPTPRALTNPRHLCVLLHLDEHLRVKSTGGSGGPAARSPESPGLWVLPWGCRARLYGVRCWPRRGTLAWPSCTLGVKAGQTGRQRAGSGLFLHPGPSAWGHAAPTGGGRSLLAVWSGGWRGLGAGRSGLCAPRGQVSPPTEDRATCLLPHHLGWSPCCSFVCF